MSSEPPATALKSHGDIDSSTKERYGQGTTLLRIGNGGAGATGLIKALASDYLTTITGDAAIEWVCNHSRNTQLALLHGYIDIALTYERDQERLAADEGWSETIGCAFHDHFCLAGPASDPANVQNAATPEEALRNIAKYRALFHSRADASATMWKERSLWEKSDTEPWKDAQASKWYQTSLLSPSEAVVQADIAGAYLLTDRSTLLRQTALQTVHNLTVFFEPEAADDVLMNSCYASVSTAARFTKQGEATSDFLKYLFSERGQNVIASYGEEELGGFQLFSPVQKGYSRSFLRGGCPRNGRWIAS